MSSCSTFLELDLCHISVVVQVILLQAIVHSTNWILVYFSLPLAKPHPKPVGQGTSGRECAEIRAGTRQREADMER